MNPILIIALLCAPTIFALLALRFGPDSRPSYRSDEHTLALRGIRWDNVGAPIPAAPHVRKLRLVSVDRGQPYPILARIDGARGAEAVPFASDPHAARLEDRARQLADAYWSDSVWLTGLVPATAFRVVCKALERERLTTGQSMELPLTG